MLLLASSRPIGRPDPAAIRMEVAGRVVEGVREERGRAREHYDRSRGSASSLWASTAPSMRGFSRRLAERGGGSCELVESEDRLDEVMAAVHRRIGTPLLTGLSWGSDDLVIEPGELVPRRLPDLFAGSPLLILGRYRGRPAGTLMVRAKDAAGRAWSEPVPAQVRDNPAIAAALRDFLKPRRRRGFWK